MPRFSQGQLLHGCTQVLKHSCIELAQEEINSTRQAIAALITELDADIRATQSTGLNSSASQVQMETLLNVNVRVFEFIDELLNNIYLCHQPHERSSRRNLAESQLYQNILGLYESSLSANAGIMEYLTNCPNGDPVVVNTTIMQRRFAYWTYYKAIEQIFSADNSFLKSEDKPNALFFSGRTSNKNSLFYVVSQASTLNIARYEESYPYPDQNNSMIDLQVFSSGAQVQKLLQPVQLRFAVVGANIWNDVCVTYDYSNQNFTDELCETNRFI